MIVSIDYQAALVFCGFITVAVGFSIWILWRIYMASIGFTVNITINPSASPLSVVSDPLNITGEVGKPLTVDLASNVQGGVAPINFAVSAGTLPAGLSFNGSVLSGTPANAGTTTVGVTVTDSAA